MYNIKSLVHFFDQNLQQLNCHQDTRSYIVNIFSNFKNSNNDFSTESITIKFAEARNNANFMIYQQLGDWLFFSHTLYPEFLSSRASLEYFETIGRLSYYSCYRLLNRQWILYENLADEFVDLSIRSRKIIQNI